MTGSDALGWAMYIDGSRSWFVHGGAHGGRAAGGIAHGSTVGVLLDLTRGTLRFTVDDRPQVHIHTHMHICIYTQLNSHKVTRDEAPVT